MVMVMASLVGAGMTGNPSRADYESAPWFSESGARWIWPGSVGDGQNQYVQVLQDFNVPHKDADAKIAISADTSYAIWVNGQFAGFGQWSDYPDDKTYDVLDISESIHAGTNRLALLVWYQGLSSSQYRKGEPGVAYALRVNGDVMAKSGVGSLMRQAPDYVSGPVPRVSGQLSFTFEHRANRDDNWREQGYVPTDDWHAATESESRHLASRPVRMRPIAKLTFEPRLPMRIVSQGAFVRNDVSSSAGVAMQGDSLSFRAARDLFANPRPTLDPKQTDGIELKPDAWRGSTGAYVVLDTGSEEAGLLDLEIDAPAGTVLDIGYGEHLEDLRVRTSIGGRSFGSRYVARAGPQQFVHPFLRLAGRYIQLHIQPEAGSTEPIVLKYAGLRPTSFPAPRIGSFKSPDALMERIYKVSRRTLELCMHEHYEDCPWREQALYAMDARNQALTGYYTFGNYDFARASIYLLGKGMNKDGWLELCAPAEVPITIPSFSLAWILMLDDYLLFSGDLEFVKSQLPIVRQILATSERDTSGPLIATPRGPRNWNFYEWAPGLDGGDGPNDVERFDAPLNLFYLLALDATARMEEQTGADAAELQKKADALREAFAGTFWDAERAAFRTRVGEGQVPHFAELTQSLALLARAVPEKERGPLLAQIAGANSLVPCTISHTLYKFEALLTEGERYAPRVFELIERDWGYMLMHGATSFWETIDGASAFDNAGSLCHGWSGIPAYFYARYLLGVRPVEPGFARYAMEPVTNVIPYASGKVPTPSGVLLASWAMENGKPEKTIEKCITAP